MPDGIKNKRLFTNMSRGIASDIRDIYRRAGEDYSYRAAEFHIPLYLMADYHDSLRNRLELIQTSPDRYMARETYYPVDENDIRHMAAEDESYEDLVDRYVDPASEWPETYAFHKDQRQHVKYMAQQIRHYNMNQPLWPGKVYYIPSYLLNGRYYRDNPPVALKKRTKEKLAYANGLEVLLSHHVTRRKTYWRRKAETHSTASTEVRGRQTRLPGHDSLAPHRSGAGS